MSESDNFEKRIREIVREEIEKKRRDNINREAIMKAYREHPEFAKWWDSALAEHGLG